MCCHIDGLLNDLLIIENESSLLGNYSLAFEGYNSQ